MTTATDTVGYFNEAEAYYKAEASNAATFVKAHKPAAFATAAFLAIVGVALIFVFHH